MSESIKYKKFKKIPIPMYRQMLYVGIGGDVLAKKFKVPDLKISPRAAGITSYIQDNDGMVAFCITFAEVPDTEEIAHEATHAAWMILDEVGIKLSPDNHEPLAYLTGWIAAEIEQMFV